MEQTQPCRIAMWSGPRNVSTALLRSWGNREDTHVIDEPFYGHYLTQGKIDHPGVDDVIAHHENDWEKVVATLTGPVPGGKAIFYQKHMTHHMLPHLDRSWMARVTNCFLIREPGEVLQSLIKVMPRPTIVDTGFPQQAGLFDLVRENKGAVPPVVDARDLLENPERILRLLCKALGVPFSERMLSWSAGPRDTDGVWGKHWYANVNKSTGFAAYRPRDAALAPEHTGVLHQCQEHYRLLYPHRLGAGG